MCQKNSQNSVTHDRMHMYICKTDVCSEVSFIIAESLCNFKLEIQESISIKLLKPNLNKNISSVPLQLF